MGQQVERAHVRHDESVQRLDGIFLANIDLEFLKRSFAADLNKDRGGGGGRWGWDWYFYGDGTGHDEA